MRVLGIDPGLANTGWSIVESDGNRYSVIDYGVIKTSPSNDLTPRIAEIVSSILQIVQKYNPKGYGAEDIFFVKNISSGISVAKVIGALSYALNNTGIDVRLFTPTEIKKAIVGV